ncbi:sugar kinase [Labrys portucalensis]|uniref:Sugar kinase n=1 Tax=Labrys neptuniae TaxID=376174 RepID=A0ABV6ZAR3_9HYPH|nr:MULTISPECIES: sugar kinase [Labrys]MDT3378913.1 sugar kinase [Labrys neptuniae]MDZ5448396.1 sugar kinase [Labrys sp. ZIDIC5]
MEALFIGHAYIDVTFVADDMPRGDEKSVAKDYAVAFGGNATTAAFCCAKLGVIPDLITTNSNDWLGRMFMDMAAKYGISVHPRKVKRSSLSFIMPKDGKRAIVRARDDDYLHPYPHLNLGNCRALHLDGHLADAALYYAKEFRKLGRLVSLDGGGLRSNTDELLNYVDVAVVAERLCEQMNLTETEMLDYLKGKGCKIAGVTAGERGMLWYDESGKVQRLPALNVPKASVVDTNGAGDIFHGAYMYSYLSRPLSRWEEHFRFARGASTHAIQFLGNEAKLPTRADVESIETRFQPVAAS